MIYRTHAGLLEAEYSLQELRELHALVEHGPNWYAIDRMEIRITTPSTMTLEQSLAI